MNDVGCGLLRISSCEFTLMVNFFVGRELDVNHLGVCNFGYCFHERWKMISYQSHYTNTSYGYDMLPSVWGRIAICSYGLVCG